MRTIIKYVCLMIVLYLASAKGVRPSELSLAKAFAVVSTPGTFVSDVGVANVWSPSGDNGQDWRPNGNLMRSENLSPNFGLEVASNDMLAFIADTSSNIGIIFIYEMYQDQVALRLGYFASQSNDTRIFFFPTNLAQQLYGYTSVPVLCSSQTLPSGAACSIGGQMVATNDHLLTSCEDPASSTSSVIVLPATLTGSTCLTPPSSKRSEPEWAGPPPIVTPIEIHPRGNRQVAVRTISSHLTQRSTDPSTRTTCLACTRDGMFNWCYNPTTKVAQCMEANDPSCQIIDDYCCTDNALCGSCVFSSCSFHPDRDECLPTDQTLISNEGSLDQSNYTNECDAADDERFIALLTNLPVLFSQISYDIRSLSTQGDVSGYLMCLAPWWRSNVPIYGFCDSTHNQFPCNASILYNQYIDDPTDGCPLSFDFTDDVMAFGWPDWNSVAIYKRTNGTEPFFQDWRDFSTDNEFGYSISISSRTDNDTTSATLFVISKGDAATSRPGYAAMYRNVYLNSEPTYDTWFLSGTQIPNLNYPTKANYAMNVVSNPDTTSIIGTDSTQSNYQAFMFNVCPAGEHFWGSMCIPCPAGTYKEDNSFQSCTPCEAGTYNPNQGQISADACLNCTGDVYCPIGSFTQIPNALYSQDWTFTIANPDYQKTDELKFETTFFYSTGPYLIAFGGFLFVVSVFMLISAVFGGMTKKIGNVLQAGFKMVNINILFPEHTSITGCYTVMVVVVLIFNIFFGFSVFFHPSNQQIDVVIGTLREAPDRDNFNLIDTPPFQISVGIISWNSPCQQVSSVSPSFSGCSDPAGLPCVVTVSTNDTRYNVGGYDVPICNITASFPQGTRLANVADFTLVFSDPAFNVSHIIYTIATLNDEELNTTVFGNSYLQDVLMPGGKGTYVMKGQALINIATTISYAQDCSSKLDLAAATGFLKVASDSCNFNRSSSKIMSEIDKNTDRVGIAGLYDSRDIGFNLTLRFSKAQFMKITSFSLFNNREFVSIWVILFFFGLVGCLQLMSALMSRIVDVIEKLHAWRKGRSKVHAELDMGNMSSPTHQHPMDEKLIPQHHP